MAFEGVVAISDAEARLASQYQSSPIFKNWLNIYLNQTTEVCSAACQYAEFFNVDIAVGKWLEVIGRIVGQPRLVADSANLDIFGFDGDVTNFPFNVGVFTDGNYGAIPVDASDMVYRRMIKARVLRNATNGSTPDLVKGVMILSERTDFIFTDLGDPMQFGLEFDGGVDAISKTLIEDYDLLPRPCGVKLIQVV